MIEIYLLSSIINELKSCMVVISVFLGIAIFIYGISCSVDYDMFHSGVSNIKKELLNSKLKLLKKMIIVFSIFILLSILIPNKETLSIMYNM